MTVDRRDRVRAGIAIYIWMLRAGFLVIGGMMAYVLLSDVRMGVVQLIGYLAVLVVMGVGGEFFYTRELRTGVQVDIDANGAHFHPPAYYRGLFKGKGFTVPRGSVVRVDVNRDRMAGGMNVAPAGGVPDSLVLVTSDGKLHGIVFRNPIQISRAAAFVKTVWGITPTMEGKEEIDAAAYGEFANTYRSKDYLIMVGVIVFISSMMAWTGTWVLRGGSFVAIGALVTIIMLPILVLGIVGLRSTYRRDNTLLSVIVRPQGFVLVFKDRRRELLWTEITGIIDSQSQNFTKAGKQISVLKIGKKEMYALSREPAMALKKGYYQSMNRMVPSQGDQPIDRSGFTGNNLAVIKSERPDLHRSNMRVSGGLLANAVYMFTVAFLGSPLLILVGVFVMIALVSVKMKVTREMKLYIERRNGGMSPTVPYR